MLTIGKIGGEGKGHWASPSYYSQQVVRGAEDYYAGKGEAPGSWVGSGAAALGLEGVIADGELEARGLPLESESGLNGLERGDDRTLEAMQRGRRRPLERRARRFRTPAP